MADLFAEVADTRSRFRDGRRVDDSLHAHEEPVDDVTCTAARLEAVPCV
jgi:hypothetical protein